MVPPPLAVESLDAGTCGVPLLQTPRRHAAAQAARLSPRPLPPGHGPPSRRPWVCQPPTNVRGPQEAWRSSRGLCLEGADQPGQLLHRPGRGHGEMRLGPGAGDGGLAPSIRAQRRQGSSLRVSSQLGGQREQCPECPWPPPSPREAWEGRWGRGSPTMTTRQATQGSAGHLWIPRARPHSALRGPRPKRALRRAVMGSCTPRTLPENLRAPWTSLGEGGG